MIPYCKDWLDILQICAICATLLVLIWYAIETSGLKRAAKKQNEFSMRPCITVFFSEPEGKIIRLRNIGKGPAFNVFMEKYISPDSGEKITFSNEVDIIEPLSESNFNFSIYDGSNQDPTMREMEIKIFPFDEFDFKIFYQNMMGNWYLSILTVNFLKRHVIFICAKDIPNKKVRSLAEEQRAR